MHTSELNQKHDPSDKIALGGVERQVTADENLKGEIIDDEGEVFKSHTGHTEFRALGWYAIYPSTSSAKHVLTLLPQHRIRAAIILMKLCFATGVLAIPSALNVVGYGPGVILLVCWGAMTTCGYSAARRRSLCSVGS